MVAAVVALAVVVLFEVIQVENNGAQAKLTARCQLPQVIQALLKKAAIANAGEGIFVRVGFGPF